MKNRSRIFAFMFILTLALLIPMPVSAAQSVDNFTKKNSYTGFTDVTESSWYYPNVRSVFELGLMNGRGDGVFDPDGSLTNAEVFTLAARLHAIYNTGKADFKASAPWYQVYADYVKNNICDTAGYDPASPATRLGFAKTLAKALPESALPAINRVDDRAIPDVPESDEVYLLYRAGILTGSDAAGSFLPDSGIRRSEAAAIVTRMADRSLRKSVTLVRDDKITVNFDINDRSYENTDLILDSNVYYNSLSPYAGKITTDPDVQRGGKDAYLFSAADAPHSMTFKRIVKAEPDTVYKISLEMKTDSVAGAKNNQVYSSAYISGTMFNESKHLSATNDWTTLSVVQASDSEGYLELAVYLGFFHDQCVGRAWFTDATVEKIDVSAYAGYESSFDASEWGDKKHIRTSLYSENDLDFIIDGDILTVSGKLDYAELDSLWIVCGSAQEIFDAESGRYFEKSITINEAGEVILWAKRTGDEFYTSYIYEQLYIASDNGGYSFAHSGVLENNLSEMSKPKNPAEYLSYSISDAIVAKSNEIVGSETDDYKKLLLIHDWVADNIYYDWDYYTGRSKTLYYTADDVLHERRTVCAGYAELTKALVQAQGIPCMIVETFATGVSTTGGFDISSNINETEANHAHNEAFVDGRWVVLDTTWDSQNKYENGKFLKDDFTHLYFDMTPDFFAFTHKILDR